MTYFVVQSFRLGSKGVLIADEPWEAASDRQAKSAAERLAQERAGAIAFFRTGNPDSGDWEDAVIIASHGLVPDEDRLAKVG